MNRVRISIALLTAPLALGAIVGCGSESDASSALPQIEAPVGDREPQCVADPELKIVETRTGDALDLVAISAHHWLTKGSADGSDDRTEREALLRGAETTAAAGYRTGSEYTICLAEGAWAPPGPMREGDVQPAFRYGILVSTPRSDVSQVVSVLVDRPDLSDSEGRIESLARAADEPFAAAVAAQKQT